MDFEIQSIYEKINEITAEVGFKPMKEFSAVDSLIYRNCEIAFYNLKSCEEFATAIIHDSLKFVSEIDCVFEIRLMGKSCDYVDYEDFEKLTSAFFGRLSGEENLLIKGLKYGRVYQSMPLKRLARDVELCLRICIEED